MTAVTFAANNGAVGGGEVMLLRMAGAASSLGADVRIVAPRDPGGLAEAAKDAGLATTVLPADDRYSYMRRLRAWDRQRSGVLWCNGLVPALATAGHRRRVVHLHQIPEGTQAAAARVASWGAVCVLVPSEHMSRRVRGARVLPNWTDEARPLDHPGPTTGTMRVGFLGRLSQDKGVDTLAAALAHLAHTRPVRLVLAGDGRFVSDAQTAGVREALAQLDGAVAELGWLARDDFFAQVDLVVVPSTAEESFGLVAAEAMAAGVPLVVSDVGALREVVGPAYPWVARAGDAADLAGVIDRAIGAADVETVLRDARLRWEAEYSPRAGRRRLAVLLRDLGVVPTGETAKW